MADNNMNLNNTPEQELDLDQLEQVNGGFRLKNELNILGIDGAELQEIISGSDTPETPAAEPEPKTTKVNGVRIL
jgi:hypothetical protein